MPSRDTKPAYLVEGDLEQIFVQNICPHFPVRKIGVNGENVEISAIAKRIGTLVRLLPKKYRPIIIIFDRERREATCDAIEAQLREYIERENINVPMIVAIPDRDIENWILADYEVFCECSGCPSTAPIGGFEGTKGKTKLKQLLPSGRSYVETIHGVQWLKKCRANKIASASPSFAKLRCSLEEIKCWWLESTVV